MNGMLNIVQLTSMNTFIAKIKQTLVRYDMLPLVKANTGVKQKWVVAVSGGPDSMALWHACLSLSQALGLELVVAHLNHGLRKNESDEDAQWVAQATEHPEIPFYIKKVDTEKIAKERKLGIEETARDLRYSFFEEVAQETGATAVATGHNLDDQAETVLMRLVRGAGMDGLGGIPPVNQKGKLRLVRPLIQVSRAEILDYLKREEKKFRLDKSNTDMKYRRNYVRHQLLPELEKEWNPAVKTILSRSADQHREVFSYIEEETEKWWQRSVRLNGTQARLKGGVLKKASPFMRQEIVKRVIRRLAPGSSERFHAEHLVQTADLLVDKRGESKISLPDGVFAQKSGKDLFISIGE